MTRRVRWAAIAVVCALIALAVLGYARGWIGDIARPPAVVATTGSSSSAATGSSSAPADDPIRALFVDRRSGVEVQGAGVVSRVLPDDDEGSRHQRFILTTPSGVTILIAHNIDIAPRLDGLAVGDRVGFLGEYEWSEKGGTVHWTHHDPADRHQKGWLTWKGRTYS